MSNDRMDRTRLTDARETVTFMCSRIQPDGFLLPPEALFCETTGYQSEAAATIALAGNKLDMPEAFEPAKRMVDRLLQRRLSSGLLLHRQRKGLVSLLKGND